MATTPTLQKCPHCGSANCHDIPTARDANNEVTTSRVLCVDCGSGSPSVPTWNMREAKFDKLKVEMCEDIAQLLKGHKRSDENLLATVRRLLDDAESYQCLK